jgi:hypothetical protein
MVFAYLGLVYVVVGVEELSASETFGKRKIDIGGVLYKFIHDFLPLRVVSGILCY